MELEQLNNSQLNNRTSNYEFNETVITLEDGKEVFLEGVFDVEFSEEDDSFDHEFGTETLPVYHEVDVVNITITSIQDEECKKITLNDEEKLSCIGLIEDNIRNQEVETI